MEDREIINLYFSRDESAISATDSKYGALCRKIIKNILSSDHDAEECLNDLYLSIWNKIPPTVPDNLRNYYADFGDSVVMYSLDTVDFTELEKIYRTFATARPEKGAL